MGGWLGGLRDREEAPMGSGLFLSMDLLVVLPLELNTGLSKKPAKMFSRGGLGWGLFAPVVVVVVSTVAFERGWSVGDASMV